MKTTAGVDVQELGKCQQLLPPIKEFEGQKGHETRYRVKGTREWQREKPDAPHEINVRVRSHDGERITPAGRRVIEAMRPFAVADNERQARIQAAIPLEVMTDAGGRAQYVRPEWARVAARHNGWKPKSVFGGRRVVDGLTEGMLWASDGRGGWEPLGVRCLGRPLRGPQAASRTMVHVSPDGVPWKWDEGTWRKVEECTA